MSEPTTGTLEVTTATTGVETDPDGYTLQVDSDSPQPIGLAATWQSGNLAEGSYTVALSGIAANCVVEGENPRTVSITAGETTTVTFAITCGATAGNLRVTAATAGPSPDIDGYELTLDGADRGTIGSTAETTFDGLTAGPHSIGLAGVAGNCLVEGENPRAVTVTAGGTATADFVVTCQTPPASTGSIQISTTTSGSGTDPDGYQFLIDGGGTQVIGSTAEVTVSNVATGAHSVQLVGVASQCSVAATNPRTVTVTANNTTQVAFALTCSTVANRLALATQPSAEAQSGVVLARQPVVRLEDANGSPVATSGVSVVASLASGQGTLGGTTTRQTDATGQAAYTDLLITGPAGEYTIRFEAPGSGYAGVTSEAVVVSSSSPTYQMTELDFLPRSINQAGHIVGTRGRFTIPSSGIAQAVIWRDGVSTDLGTLGGTSSEAVAINEHDVVVGASTTASGEVHGFLWDGTMHDLGAEFVPKAINDAGDMVGAASGHVNTQFRSGDQTVSTGGCNAISGKAGLNNLGQMVGQWFNDEEGEPRVCIWDDGVLQDLDMDEGHGNDINEHGSVVGRIDNFPGTIIAFYWRNGVETFLPTLGGIANGASAINDSEIIVGHSGEDPENEALAFPVVWKEGIVTKLSEEYGGAGDINNSGWIVGVITPEVGVVTPRGVLWRPVAR